MELEYEHEQTGNEENMLNSYYGCGKTTATKCIATNPEFLS